MENIICKNKYIWLDDIDNKEILREIVIKTCKDLTSKKR